MKKHSAFTVVAGLFALTWTVWTAPAAAQPLYTIFGRAAALYATSAEVESTTTSAVPGLTPADPELVCSGPDAVPLAAVTIEAFEVPGDSLLGTGQANLDGYFRVEYHHALADHQVRFRVSLSFEDGGSQLIGEAGPVLVDNQLFAYELGVCSTTGFPSGTSSFSTAGEFVFIQVGDIEMHNIYDQQQDPADPNRWGLTKPPGPGHSRGPDWAFGRDLELYGLFEETTPARYYQIHYSGPETGTIQTPLWKTNYVIVGTGIEVHRRLLGPKNVGPLTGVYELDEFLDGQPIPDHPGRFYSTFWTRPGLRAIFDTDRSRGNPADDLTDGKYELSVEAWNAAFAPVPAATNNFSTLSLHLVNTPPEVKIHNLQYLNGDIVLSDAAPCNNVLLNRVSSPTFDDSLQFEITARHATRFPDPLDPTHSGLRRWQLFAWHGHDTPDGAIAEATYPFAAAPPDHDVFATPGTISYQSCAYRFRLRAWPRITNGRDTVYVREDNWYVAIQVLTP